MEVKKGLKIIPKICFKDSMHDFNLISVYTSHEENILITFFKTIYMWGALDQHKSKQENRVQKGETK
jgi:hypothetical protein